MKGKMVGLKVEQKCKMTGKKEFSLLMFVRLNKGLESTIHKIDFKLLL